MTSIEQHVRDAFEGQEPLRPLEIPADVGPVLATPALAYGALTFAAYMAGNVVTDFVGDEAPTSGGTDEVSGRSGADLLALRSARIAR